MSTKKEKRCNECRNGTDGFHAVGCSKPLQSESMESVSLQKESEWERKLDYNSTDLGELGKFVRIEYAKNITSKAVSNREKEIAEEVEGRKSKPSYGAYTTQDAKVFWEGKDAAFDEVLSILKH